MYSHEQTKAVDSAFISIVMPVYNAEAYLRTTLDSLVNQTYKNIEILCINDGSFDRSVDILDEYAKKDSRIHVYTKENTGAADSRNYGLKLAKGEYIMFLDADDIFNYQLLEKLYNKISITQSDVCFCNYTATLNGRPQWTSQTPPLEDVFKAFDVAKSIFQATHPVPWNKMFRLDFIKRNHIEFINISSSNDISFSYISLIKASKITHINESLILYNTSNQASITNSKNEKIKNVFIAYDEIYSRIRDEFDTYCESFYSSLCGTLHYYISKCAEYRKETYSYKFMQDMIFISLYNKTENSYDILHTIINKLPLISILMPVYNAEKFLPQAIESLLNQTLRSIEIICVNDGSKDNSLQILNKYNQIYNNIVVIDQKNSGPAHARNVALAHATAPYIMFCDADDWYEKNMCEQMIFYLLIRNVDFVMCDCSVIEEDKDHHRNKFTIDYHYLHTYGYHKLDNSNKAWKASVVLWNKIFRSSFIKNYNITFPEGRECDDNAFIYQYMSLSSTVYGINQKLYNYRLLGNSLMGKLYSKKTVHKLYDIIYSIKYSIDFMKKYNLLQKNTWIIRVANEQTNWAISHMPDNMKLVFFEKMKEIILPEIAEYDISSYDMLKYIQKKGPRYVLRQYNKRKYICLFGLKLLTKTKKDNNTSYSFHNKEIFKIKNEGHKTKFYLFGIKIFSRKSIYKYIDIKFEELRSQIKR